MRSGWLFGRLRRRGVGLAVVAVATASCVGAGSARATPRIPHSFRHFEVPASVELRARTMTSGGYVLRVIAGHQDVPAQEGQPASTFSTVSLDLNKIGSSAEYFSRDSRFEVDGTIESDWGPNGRIAARFVPLHTHREPVRWCDGDYTVEAGLLVGALIFHGEHGYATARSTAVSATLTRRPKMTCHITASVKPSHEHQSARVEGTFGRRGRLLGVDAYEHPALGTVTVLAYSSEHRGGVAVTRRVSAVAPLSALAIDPAAEAATLTPPSPFSGSARFQAFPGKESGTWLGNLSVDFPGEPGVRLAGKRFEGAKLKPGECSADGKIFCVGIKMPPPVGLKPMLPLGG